MKQNKFPKTKIDIINILDKGTELLESLKVVINTFNSLEKPTLFKRSPYDILGVHPDDPDELIKKIYQVKAKTYHPDKGINTGSEKFIQLKKAYDEILEMRKNK